jgi:hypothetical protein
MQLLESQAQRYFVSGDVYRSFAYGSFMSSRACAHVYDESVQQQQKVSRVGCERRHKATWSAQPDRQNVTSSDWLPGMKSLLITSQVYLFDLSWSHPVTLTSHSVFEKVAAADQYVYEPETAACDLPHSQEPSSCQSCCHLNKFTLAASLQLYRVQL